MDIAGRSARHLKMFLPPPPPPPPLKGYEKTSTLEGTKLFDPMPGGPHPIIIEHSLITYNIIQLFLTHKIIMY